MRAILFEDEPIKKRDVSRELTTMGFKVEAFDNLRDGVSAIQSDPEGVSIAVSDMYYPLEPGKDESESGTRLLEILKEIGIGIPVVIVSSAALKVPEALACVHYSLDSYWEDALRRAVKNAVAFEERDTKEQG